MLETMPGSVSSIPHISEREVNREINDTELVFSRALNPVIGQQLNMLLLQIEIERLRRYKEDEWVPFLPEGWTGEENYKLMKNTRTNANVDRDTLERLRAQPYPTLEEIAAETSERISVLATETTISFGTDSPNTDKLALDWKIPWTKQKPTAKQWSIIEGHEKGHGIRLYYRMDEHFRSGFDLSAVNFTAEDHAMHISEYEQSEQKAIDHNPNETTAEFALRYLNEYLFTAPEIAERMSQLKNYFGFAGNEVFTKQHLDYAKEHYLEDTGMDNAMRLFFEGITPETEGRFLELINSSGI